MFHALRTNSGEREKRMAIKTDMSKAYDRLEWEFISAVMKKMRFSEIWIEWIMRCVSSVKYHVLFNGQPRGNITHNKVCDKEILCLLSYLSYARKCSLAF